MTSVPGSGVPGVEEPSVTSSNPIWFAVPLKFTDIAVPLNATPIGNHGQNCKVGRQGPTPGVEGVVGRLSDASIVPVAFGPDQTVTTPGELMAL